MSGAVSMGNKQTNQQSYRRRAFTTVTDESLDASTTVGGLDHR